ncbi:phosphoribulokinase /uridine kinase family protein [Entamoeba histolytica HM-1:IMSS-B]|uniref:Phosphoribulokinase /uridine kinase family protein n=6 Tax=Entamoeba histolytica TaxID=5759 RepID=C4LXT6_ENTH1|nr:phosphoribulokinase /uridine kinase family protein [Entamoeba histolytica HM-1:IMSS]EMD42754.1 phosphoribulokinase, putative [Entamoeba histolytica KU27]EMH73870.1 phosphoribulokinase /uridine kinase family protein [Entamoeba histolytica HM-1:IMSS-B]EMS14822.1 phosphoribulokinase [Entamoeba histolytica HM-3:IMSS]ENY65116.1 phosphoribulokinase, putative [Entamoeba histolytica HM-1:IMSS-A]GAT93587.1 phosphoribulokinase uridine kinase family protein [Entamoeba histolytica]|eukprot:XP_651360.1 phosphoribulokinase /uridine kinase family protein [Entamoeba histolytica HM-1:IMSS]
MTSVVYNEKLYNLSFPVTCDQVVKEIGIQGTPAVIVGLKVNGIVQSLNSYIPTKRCTISPCYIRCVEGQNMARRSEILIARYALHKLYPDVEMTVIADYSDCTEFCVSPKLNEEQLKELNKEFNELHTQSISNGQLPHSYLNLHFVETHQPHSKSLIESLNEPTYPCAIINNFATLSLDQPYISEPSILPEYSQLKLESNGSLLVCFPSLIHTDSYKFNDAPIITCPHELNKEMDVGYVNKQIAQKTINELMIESENYHVQQLSKLIEVIKSRPTQLVLIAGPSSSGKTTFAHKLGLGLQGVGYNPLVLSVDNYYVHKDYCPLGPDGKRDWECIEALRLGLLNDHLCGLMQGKEIVVPQFDFATSTPLPNKGTKVKLEKNGIIIMEGIHCLNERLTEKIPHDKKVKVFIAPLSNKLCLNDDVILNNNFLRIQRRMVRDNIFRSYSASKTLGVWDAVASSEKIWIYPYIKDADFVYSTFLTTEVNGLITFSLNLLRMVSSDDKNYGFAQSYKRLLQYYLPMDSVDFAGNSILREFIGNGDFDCH